MYVCVHVCSCLSLVMDACLLTYTTSFGRISFGVHRVAWVWLQIFHSWSLPKMGKTSITVTKVLSTSHNKTAKSVEDCQRYRDWLINLRATERQLSKYYQDDSQLFPKYLVFYWFSYVSFVIFKNHGDKTATCYSMWWKTTNEIN